MIETLLLSSPCLRTQCWTSPSHPAPTRGFLTRSVSVGTRLCRRGSGLGVEGTPGQSEPEEIKDILRPTTGLSTEDKTKKTTQ